MQMFECSNEIDILCTIKEESKREGNKQIKERRQKTKSLDATELIVILDPRGQFHKTLTPAFFYWCKNAK